MPRLAANISLLFREHVLPQRIAAAANAGFSAVECLWPYEVSAERMRDELARHRMTLALINTPLGPAHFGLAAAALRHDDFSRLFDVALHYAVTAGAARIHVMAGEHAIDAANRAALVANLRAAGAKAADAGIGLVIEPINSRDRPHWFLKSTQQALDILDAVNHPSVQLLFDIYHVQIIEGDLTWRLEACFDRIGHVQVAGVPARHEPDDSEIAVAHVFATLDRLGFAGFVGCEYNPRGATQAGLGWAAAYGVTPKQRAGRDA
jgi:hydroxypyruvate isomerase